MTNYGGITLKSLNLLHAFRILSILSPMPQIMFGFLWTKVQPGKSIHFNRLMVLSPRYHSILGVLVKNACGAVGIFFIFCVEL